MINDTSLLRQNELFSLLTEEELTTLAPTCFAYAIVEEAVLFTEGRSATHLYVVTEGELSL